MLLTKAVDINRILLYFADTKACTTGTKARAHRFLT